MPYLLLGIVILEVSKNQFYALITKSYFLGVLQENVLKISIHYLISEFRNELPFFENCFEPISESMHDIKNETHTIVVFRCLDNGVEKIHHHHLK